MFYHKACLELQNVTNQIKMIEQKMKQCPKGMLFSRQNGEYHKWYYSDKGKTVYIPKKNRALAEKLFRKKYFTCLLNDSLRQKKALESYMKSYGSAPTETDSLLNSSKYEEFAPSLYDSLPEYIRKWTQEEYVKNPFYPEEKKVPGAAGEYFRSKSEAWIQKELLRRGIPHRYECALTLGDRTLYPDFMILHPVTGKLIIWEHYGMLDDPEYVRRKLAQVELYLANGFFPSVNFIATFESLEHPLDFSLVEKIIETYLT
ncbi:MAG: hypothetical protein Q4E53_14635 [Eubacteriales bacterium]|nr:hypothetical protein [Eubacteriales bacterium]